MTYDEMIRLLKKGRDQDDKPLNLKKFGRPGTKSLKRLHKEVGELDVALELQRNEKGILRVLRIAYCVKIYITAHENAHNGGGVRRYNLYELERRRRGVVIGGRKPWSISETRKRGEQRPEAAIRGLQEELGLEVTEDDFIFPIVGSDHENVHESSVYPGILSCSYDYRLDLLLPKRLGKRRQIIVKDHGGTEVALQWERDWPKGRSN